jgi:hypothetical protein
MSRGPDAAKREVWQRRLERFAPWAGTVAEFCQREGVSIPSFYQWRRKLASTRAKQATPSGAAISRGFLPIEITGQSNIEVLLPGGVRVLVPCREQEALRTVLATLLSVPREGQSC